MSRSLFRCKVRTSPFQHCRVVFPGSATGKLTPLIVFDLNTGAVAMETMVGCKAENVFMALQRLQFCFGTEIVQAYTDKKKIGKILGETSDYWSERLGGT